MITTQRYVDDLTYEIIGCAIEVHKELGPGLIESIYEKCFVRELSLQSIDFKTQLWLPVQYKGMYLDAGLRLNVLIEDLILVELKAIDFVLPVHHAQVLTYMKLMQKPKGILINCNCTNIFKEGQKTFVNELYAALPKA
ncbi:MAG: GxxExxY protein [Bacteroidetes bacterium]|nr:GxxExxY protein [Bacteroidota bacterium]